jgi:hypothetical protein
MSAITESVNKSAQRDYHLAQMGIPVNRDVGKYGHLDYLVQIAPKSSYNTNALTTPAQIDFEFKYSPHTFSKTTVVSSFPSKSVKQEVLHL